MAKYAQFFFKCFPVYLNGIEPATIILSGELLVSLSQCRWWAHLSLKVVVDVLLKQFFPPTKILGSHLTVQISWILSYVIHCYPLMRWSKWQETIWFQTRSWIIFFLQANKNQEKEKLVGNLISSIICFILSTLFRYQNMSWILNLPLYLELLFYFAILFTK